MYIKVLVSAVCGIGGIGIGIGEYLGIGIGVNFGIDTALVANMF